VRALSGRLFFYGVLMGEVAPPPVRLLLAGLGPGRGASAQGDLFAVDEPLGAHPAMVAGKGRVRGIVHDAGSVDLAALDLFEGDAYARRPIRVTAEDGETIEAEAYLWLGATTDLEPIPDGDFARWLRASGKPAIGG
jgi:gamma-glutamylcyclotransferase (GGCT)/AIG2-like uncharacterized protein YtfP